MEICGLCGCMAECTHHLVFGYGMRSLADKDGLTMSLCNSCHNMAAKPQNKIHGNSVAEKLSKMLGQAMWEKKAVASGYTEEDARKLFINRYGRSWL